MQLGTGDEGAASGFLAAVVALVVEKVAAGEGPNAADSDPVLIEDRAASVERS